MNLALYVRLFLRNRYLISATQQSKGGFCTASVMRLHVLDEYFNRRPKLHEELNLWNACHRRCVFFFSTCVRTLFCTILLLRRHLHLKVLSARRYVRPRLHWSQNRHNKTVWTDARQGSGNQLLYCFCQRLHWNRSDWNVVFQQLPTVWPNKVVLLRDDSLARHLLQFA